MAFICVPLSRFSCQQIPEHPSCLLSLPLPTANRWHCDNRLCLECLCSDVRLFTAVVLCRQTLIVPSSSTLQAVLVSDSHLLTRWPRQGEGRQSRDVDSTAERSFYRIRRHYQLTLQPTEQRSLQITQPPTQTQLTYRFKQLASNCITLLLITMPIGDMLIYCQHYACSSPWHVVLQKSAWHWFVMYAYFSSYIGNKLSLRNTFETGQTHKTGPETNIECPLYFSENFCFYWTKHSSV